MYIYPTGIYIHFSAALRRIGRKKFTLYFNNLQEKLFHENQGVADFSSFQQLFSNSLIIKEKEEVVSADFQQLIDLYRNYILKLSV